LFSFGSPAAEIQREEGIAKTFLRCSRGEVTGGTHMKVCATVVVFRKKDDLK
jgi:hypothetical protein